MLGISVNKIKNKISNSSKLRAVWIKAKDIEAPTGLAVASRKAPPREVENSELALIIQDQNRVLLREGLTKAGISAKTIDKLKVFDGFGTNSGHFLIASLDLSHKMMVFSNVALLEEGEYIREHYLHDETLAPEQKIEWQRAYNEIADILGKGYDRTLAGTQAMAKMMPKQEEKGEKKKPGFRPLMRVEREDDK